MTAAVKTAMVVERAPHRARHPRSEPSSGGIWCYRHRNVADAVQVLENSPGTWSSPITKCRKSAAWILYATSGKTASTPR
jgi:hypothetical protein